MLNKTLWAIHNATQNKNNYEVQIFFLTFLSTTHEKQTPEPTEMSFDSTVKRDHIVRGLHITGQKSATSTNPRGYDLRVDGRASITRDLRICGDLQVKGAVTTGSSIAIKQSDFDNLAGAGFVIDTPGNYHFAEDVVFTPTKVASPMGLPSYLLAAITVAADNVTIKLGCQKLSQAVPDNASEQVPFVTGVHILPGSKNIHLTGGTICNFSLYGVYSGDILRDSTNEVEDLRIDNLTIDNTGRLASLAVRPDASETYNFPYRPDLPTGGVIEMGGLFLFRTISVNISDVLVSNSFYRGMVFAESRRGSGQIQDVEVFGTYSDDPGVAGPPPTGYGSLPPVGYTLASNANIDHLRVNVNSTTFENEALLNTPVNAGAFLGCSGIVIFGSSGTNELDGVSNGYSFQDCHVGSTISRFGGQYGDSAALVSGVFAFGPNNVLFTNCHVRGCYSLASVAGFYFQDVSGGALRDCSSGNHRSRSELTVPAPKIFSADGDVMSGFLLERCQNMVVERCFSHFLDVLGPAPAFAVAQGIRLLNCDENIHVSECETGSVKMLNGGTASGVGVWQSGPPVGSRGIHVEDCMTSSHSTESLNPLPETNGWNSGASYDPYSVVYYAIGTSITEAFSISNDSAPITIKVTDTSAFPSSGTFETFANNNEDVGLPPNFTVTYTGKTADTFTGCQWFLVGGPPPGAVTLDVDVGAPANLPTFMYIAANASTGVAPAPDGLTSGDWVLATDGIVGLPPSGPFGPPGDLIQIKAGPAYGHWAIRVAGGPPFAGDQGPIVFKDCKSYRLSGPEEEDVVVPGFGAHTLYTAGFAAIAINNPIQKVEFHSCMSSSNSGQGYLLANAVDCILRDNQGNQNTSSGFTDVGAGGTPLCKLTSSSLFKNNTAFANGNGATHLGEDGNYNIQYGLLNIDSVAANVAGDSYYVGDVLTVVGDIGSATVSVDSLTGNAPNGVATLSVIDPGQCFTDVLNVSTTLLASEGVTVECVRQGDTTNIADVDTGFAFATVVEGNVGVSEVSSILTTGVSAAVLGNTSFTISGNVSNDFDCYVWYNVDGTGVDPATGNIAVEVEVSSMDDEYTVAQKTAAALTGNIAGNVFGSVFNLIGGAGATVDLTLNTVTGPPLLSSQQSTGTTSVADPATYFGGFHNTSSIV